jgi:hypothetical protein
MYPSPCSGIREPTRVLKIVGLEDLWEDCDLSGGGRELK